MSDDPTPNSPADLGWTPQATKREPTRFEIPPQTRPANCSSCRAQIFWIVTKAKKRMPVNGDGTSHFATCPNADLHRKPKGSP